MEHDWFEMEGCAEELCWCKHCGCLGRAGLNDFRRGPELRWEYVLPSDDPGPDGEWRQEMPECKSIYGEARSQPEEGGS